MHNRSKYNVKQIIQGTDWSAFCLTKTEPYYKLHRLVCWQLEDVGNEGETEIVGIVAGSDKSPLERAPDLEGFHSYIHAHNVDGGDLRPIIGEHRKKLGV